MIIDSNILIYSALDEYKYLRAILINPQNSYSVITRIEVLGFKGITPAHEIYFKSIFSILKEIPLSETVVKKAIEIKQQKSMKLGDSIIAATGLVNDLKISTRNTSDFKNIPGLTAENPIVMP